MPSNLGRKAMGIRSRSRDSRFGRSIGENGAPLRKRQGTTNDCKDPIPSVKEGTHPSKTELSKNAFAKKEGKALKARGPNSKTSATHQAVTKLSPSLQKRKTTKGKQRAQTKQNFRKTLIILSGAENYQR